MMRYDQYIDGQAVTRRLQEFPFRFRLNIAGQQHTPPSLCLDAYYAGGIISLAVTAHIRVEYGEIHPVPPPVLTTLALTGLAHRQEFRDAGFHFGNRITLQEGGYATDMIVIPVADKQGYRKRYISIFIFYFNYL